MIFTSFHKASPKRERSTDIDPTQMNYQRSWNEEMMVERLMMEKYSFCRWKGKGLFPIASGGKAQSLVSVELRYFFPRSAYKKIPFLFCSPMVLSLLGSKKPGLERARFARHTALDLAFCYLAGKKPSDYTIKTLFFSRHSRGKKPTFSTDTREYTILVSRPKNNHTRKNNLLCLVDTF